MSNLLTLQQALTGSDMDRIVEGYADKGYGDLKTETAQIVLDAVGPIRARTREFLDDPGEPHEDRSPRCRKSARRGRIHTGGGVQEGRIRRRLTRANRMALV